MKHYRENGQKSANIRITLDMLPKAVQRAHKDKQLEVLKRMFKRACNLSGLFREMKDREHYVKPGEKRRRAEKQRKANARGEGRPEPDFDQQHKFDEYQSY